MLLLTCTDGCVGKRILRPAGCALAFVWMCFSCGFCHLMEAVLSTDLRSSQTVSQMKDPGQVEVNESLAISSTKSSQCIVLVAGKFWQQLG